MAPISLAPAFLIRLGLLTSTFLLATSTVVLSGYVIAQQPECDCRHLKTLQAELRNALRLQQAFRNKIPELRTMGETASRSELQRFAGSDARRGLEQVPGQSGPGEVDYVPWGDIGTDPDLSSKYTAEQLCRLADSAAERLTAAERGAACVGIGAALRAHEAVHGNFCRRIGYRPYLAMHGADRAQEEVEAYGAQIAVLRAEISRALQNANIVFKVDIDTRLEMPANPLYSAINNQLTAEIRNSRVTTSGDLIRFEGAGQQTMNGSIEGNCRLSGMPFSTNARTEVESDGLEAKLTYSVQGTIPSLGMQCTIPGSGSGSGMSMPAPIQTGNVPPSFTLPLEDGAEIVRDRASSEVGKTLGPAGIRVSGQEKLRLELECKTDR